MNARYFKRAIALATAALLLSATFAGAQDQQDILKITRPQVSDKQSLRTAPIIQLDRASAFHRMNPFAVSSQRRATTRHKTKADREAAKARSRVAASAPSLQSFGTGGGDIFEREPNDTLAQGVSLPVNIFGEISRDFDVDYFAFQSLAGQQVTIEAFAARYSGSELIADIALFDSDGDLIDVEVGDEDDDPVIRYTSSRDEVLIAGIRDIEDFGGSDMDYMLNITRGVDVEEDEPNDSFAQSLPRPSVTVFGEIEDDDDVDFYSFNGNAGQTLIVDVDAEVLGSSLDSEINLSDPSSGVEFFYNDQFDGDDSRFNIVLPYTGRYVIGIAGSDGDSDGFYRLNISLVSSSGAPLINRLTRKSSKSVEVGGNGFTRDSVIEINGRPVRTTYVNSSVLRAKVKAKTNDMYTVANYPDLRRSNPLLYR